MSDPGKLTPDILLTLHAQSREDMEVALKFPVESLRMSYEASTKFAEQAIKSGFILNGGALVLFSGFAAFFKVNPTSVVTELVVSMLAFILGLAASYFTSFLAFRSARAEARLFSHQITATILTLNRPPGGAANTVENNPSLKNQREAEAQWSSRANRFGKWAVGFGICSLIAFVFGATFSGWTLLMHAGGASGAVTSAIGGVK